MKPPIITGFKFVKTTFNTDSFETIVNINNFDRTRHRIVLQIENKTYTLTNSILKILLPRKAPTIPILPGLQPRVSIFVKAYVYDFKADEIVLARKQEFAYNPILQNYFATDTLLSTTNMILGDFTKDKKVTKIEGPFGTENKKVTTVKLGEPYTFRATPNQPVAEFYLLAIKWAYRLDDGELTYFKNQTEIANGTQAQITVTFPKSFKASKIKVYGFYTSASERVCVEVGTDYVREMVVEAQENPKDVAGTKEESPISKETESKFLVWGAKVSNEFRDKVVSISKEIWKDNWFDMANGLMAVMYRETAGSFASNQLEGYKSLIAKDKMTKDDFYKKIENSDEKTSRAVGLIQFTQSALVSMKEFKNGDGFDKLHELKLKYAKMTAVEQLDKVKKYFLSVKTLPKTKEDIYVAVFAPNFVGKPLDTIMYKKGTDSYKSNKSLDKNDNGIEVKELLDKFYESLTSGGKKENSKVLAENTKIESDINSSEDSIIIEISFDYQIKKITPKLIKKKEIIYQFLDDAGKRTIIGIVPFIEIENIGGEKYQPPSTKTKKNIHLIDIRKISSFKNDLISFNIKFFTESGRFYLNDCTTASLLGTMINMKSVDYFSGSGFSNIKGESTGGSVSHVNGMNGDLNYLRKDKKQIGLDIVQNPDSLDVLTQTNLIAELIKWGWKDPISEYFTLNKKKTLLIGTSSAKERNIKSYHGNHLHLQGYNPNFKLVEK